MVRNNVIDFVSIFMSNSKTSMAKSMTYTNTMASMVSNVSDSKASMCSTEDTNMGRGGGKESKDVDEDLKIPLLSDLILRKGFKAFENI